MSYRLTVSDANVELLGQMHETIHRLTDLWDEVSMDEENRVKRTQAAYQLFYNTMSEIVQNEQEMVKGVRDDCRCDLNEVQNIRAQLGWSPFKASEYKPNSIALVSCLRAFRFKLGSFQLQVLSKEKSMLATRKAEAMKTQLEEFQALEEACEQLGEKVPIFENIKTQVRSGRLACLRHRSSKLCFYCKKISQIHIKIAIIGVL